MIHNYPIGSKKEAVITQCASVYGKYSDKSQVPQILHEDPIEMREITTTQHLATLFHDVATCVEWTGQTYATCCAQQCCTEDVALKCSERLARP